MSHFPDMTRAEFRAQEARDEQTAWENEQAYHLHVNEACRAIQMTPVHLVTSEYITQVLCTLACRVYDASNGSSYSPLFNIHERIEALSDEIGGAR